MHKQPLRFNFQSVLSALMEKFIRDRLALGYRCNEEAACLHRFDRLICQDGLPTKELARPIVEKWMVKRSHESARTHKNRIGVVRQFARFLVRQGYEAYVPDRIMVSRSPDTWAPRIFQQAEIKRLLAASDRIRPNAQSPLRYLIIPEIFRLLYGCGMRLGEVLRLTVGDADLQQGVLTVRQGKFHKDRLIPPHPSLIQRLRKYSRALDDRDASAIFFPAPDGGPYSERTVYTIFRTLLWECHIPHGGRGHGPRIHDIRHSFACHRLAKWYREGADLHAKLPLLSTYMGHRHISGTQRYLHLTAELYPDITRRLEEAFGSVIPRRAKS